MSLTILSNVFVGVISVHAAFHHTMTFLIDTSIVCTYSLLSMYTRKSWPVESLDLESAIESPVTQGYVVGGV